MLQLGLLAAEKSPDGLSGDTTSRRGLLEGERRRTFSAELPATFYSQSTSLALHTAPFSSPRVSPQDRNDLKEPHVPETAAGPST